MVEEKISNSWLNTRTACPVCASVTFSTIYESRYNETPVKDYLVDFYSQRGIVEFEYLIDADYICSYTA